MKKIKAGKAPVCIPIELLQNGGECIAIALHKLIVKCWLGSPLPQDWIDGLLVSLFKGKGTKSDCDHHRGITLLESAGKVLARILLDRLIKNICPIIVPEAQCGFTEGRGTVDMVFTARQLHRAKASNLSSLCRSHKSLRFREQRCLVDNSWKDRLPSYICEDVSRTSS